MCEIGRQINVDGAVIGIHLHIFFLNRNGGVRYAARVGIDDLHIHLIKVDCAVRSLRKQQRRPIGIVQRQ